MDSKKFMDGLSAFMGMLNPWAGLLLQAVSMVESMSAQAPTSPTGEQKKSAAIEAVKKAITVAPAIGAEVVNMQAALQSHDPAVVIAGLGHGVEMALSISKSLGLFPKAAIVQAAPELGDNMAPGGTG